MHHEPAAGECHRQGVSEVSVTLTLLAKLHISLVLQTHTIKWYSLFICENEINHTLLYKNPHKVEENVIVNQQKLLPTYIRIYITCITSVSQSAARHRHSLHIIVTAKIPSPTILHNILFILSPQALLSFPHLNLDVRFPASEIVLSEVFKLILLHLAPTRQVESTMVSELLVIFIEAHLQRHLLLCNDKKKSFQSFSQLQYNLTNTATFVTLLPSAEFLFKYSPFRR